MDIINKNSAFTLENLLSKLEEEKLLDSATHQKITESVPSLLQKPSSPWVIHALAAMAAWWAAILFLVFAFSTRLIDGRESMFFSGILLTAIAVFLRRIPRVLEMDSTSIFLKQLALAANVAGQILLILGADFAIKNFSMICLFIIALQGIMFFLYPDVIQRFASPIIITGSSLCLLYDLKINMIIHAFVIFLGIASVYLWLKESDWNLKEERIAIKPMAYGIVVSMLGVLVLSVVESPEMKNVFPIQYWWLSSVCLGLILLLLEHRILNSYKIEPLSKQSLLAFAGTILLVVLCWNSPGLIGAILILVLGFSRGNSLLMGLSLLFFSNFLFFYYYNLQATLLQKSLILMTTGIVLLLFRALSLYLFPDRNKE